MRASFGYGTWRQGADVDGLAKSWSLLDCQWWPAIEAIWEPKVVWHKWKVIILQRHPVTFSISFQALADQRCHACLIRSRLPSFGDRWKGAELVNLSARIFFWVCCFFVRGLFPCYLHLGAENSHLEGICGILEIKSALWMLFASICSTLKLESLVCSLIATLVAQGGGERKPKVIWMWKQVS